MRIRETLDKAIIKKMAELKATVEARRRMEDRSFAVECGEDKTFWKKGFTTIRSASAKRTVIRRREVA
jgi:hypothetical protein